MEWMPLIRVDGMRSTGPVNSMLFIRLSTSDTRGRLHMGRMERVEDQTLVTNCLPPHAFSLLEQV